MSRDHSTTTVEAGYFSPTEKREFMESVQQAPTVGGTREKTAYLPSLRKSVLQVQDKINAFLTQKMEGDKAGAPPGAKISDDRMEEENYGEEVVEEGA